MDWVRDSRARCRIVETVGVFGRPELPEDMGLEVLVLRLLDISASACLLGLNDLVNQGRDPEFGLSHLSFAMPLLNRWYRPVPLSIR